MEAPKSQKTLYLKINLLQVWFLCKSNLRIFFAAERNLHVLIVCNLLLEISLTSSFLKNKPNKNAHVYLWVVFRGGIQGDTRVYITMQKFVMQLGMRSAHMLSYKPWHSRCRVYQKYWEHLGPILSDAFSYN